MQEAQTTSEGQILSGPLISVPEGQQMIKNNPNMSKTFSSPTSTGRRKSSLIKGKERVLPEPSGNKPENTVVVARGINVGSNRPIDRNASTFEKIRYYGKKLLDSKFYSIFMAICTVYALLGDDVRVWGFSVSEDNYFFDISFVVLLLFIFEVILNGIVKPNYFGSFYFFLDSAATLSLIPDIGWMWSLIVESGDGGANTMAVKAGRISRVGTKAGRIVRIVRLVRMVRIVKLYKLGKGEESETAELEAQIAAEPSKVGKKMSEMTTRRVILIVLALVFAIPFFDGGLDEQENEFQSAGLKALHTLSFQLPNLKESTFFHDIFEGYIRDGGNLIYLEVANMDKETVNQWIKETRFRTSPESDYTESVHPDSGWSYSFMVKNFSDIEKKYRSAEYIAVSMSGCYNTSFVQSEDRKECVSVAVFDETENTESSAMMNIVKTFVLMFILAWGSISFSSIAETLVITPIERMMDLIKRLAENPLANTNRHGIEFAADKKAREQGFETALLEATLSKIGALMQVGFGAAGADIIGKNMGSGELDPMIPGKKITAIYGFCDIRQFTDTTECLQEDVMVYVNKLGNIIHTGAHDYYGMANKNVGDAFLLSWKICDGELEGFSSFHDKPTEELRQRANELCICPPNPGSGNRMRRITPTEMADSALTAFLKCQIDLDNANTDGCLTEYLRNERIVKRFGTNFRIQMGFGMHVGWAIEGAIGSHFKIDATYISPHVQMADRLEAGSKMFMTPLNLSHWFVALLSPSARKYLRIMDRIQVRGASQPLTVYTFDVTNMKKGFGTPRVDELGSQCPVDFENDSSYSDIQEGLHPGFVPAFTKAVDSYFHGDWEKAKVELEEASSLKPNDGPLRALTQVLKQHNFKAPMDWKGYREVEGY